MKRLCGAVIAGLMLVPAAAYGQQNQPTTQSASDARAADREAIKVVLANYKAAIERLDASGTEELFAADSQIFETGGVEGTYQNYHAHHLGPELDHFRSFKFSDYKVDVRFEGPVALATETYRYRIETESGEVAERQGVATSVLKKVDGEWKILNMHNSARRPRGS
ncbi:YybH family protein [Sphingosinicella humi]|uniref:DUF4440 domain-containing protein n=1 Tax=Allosphingosinicella humi TaxID=2068657 RepID=A0A2U2J0W1_9SPHN|nr:SgcJ/EcaC family oxidoreductase [Sphingosinicella humi]PWG01974.1 DUF4440 domain-containing protein [Sphingosinicella humi]